MRYPARQEDPWSRRVEVGRIQEQAFRPEVAHMIERHQEHDRATQEVNRFKAFGLLRDRLRADRRHRSGRGEVRAHNTIPWSPEIVSAIPSAFSGVDWASATGDETKGGASLPGPARPLGFEKSEGRRAEGDEERVTRGLLVGAKAAGRGAKAWSRISRRQISIR